MTSLYPYGITQIFLGNIDLLKDDIKLAFVSGLGYEYRPIHRYLSDIGFVSKISESLTNKEYDDGIFRADPITTAFDLEVTITHVVVFRDTGNLETSNLLGCMSIGGNYGHRVGKDDKITINWENDNIILNVRDLFKTLNSILSDCSLMRALNEISRLGEYK